MSAVVRRGAAWVALALGGACGETGAPAPATSARLRLLDGDAQETRLADAPLARPLVVAGVDGPRGLARADLPLAWSTADGRIEGDARTVAGGRAHAVWRLAPRVGTQTAVARLTGASGGDSVVFHARLLASGVRLVAVGDTLVLRAAEQSRLAWQVVDSAGTPLAAPAVRWAGTDPRVATVTNDGANALVVGVGGGITTLTADPADLAALGVRGPAPRLVVVVRAAVAGRVHLLDPDPSATPDPRGLRVWVRTAAGVDSADVGADGRFTVEARDAAQRDAALREATEIVVDAADPAARRWIPAVWRYEPGAAVPPLRFVMIPRRWRIAAGAFRGEEVAVDLTAALGAGIPDPAAGERWYDRNWFFKQVAPLGGTTGAPATMEAFPDDAYPIPVYLDRERSRFPPTAADSLDLWRSLDALHASFGATLFRPAEKGALADPRQGVAVVIDSTLFDGLAASTWSTRCTPREPVADPNCAGVVDRVDATLYFSGRSRSIRNRDLVLHEMGHVLGLGHTCYWWSIMYGQLDYTSVVGPSCQGRWLDGAWPGGFIERTAAYTARDVAYLSLYLRTAATVRRIGPAHGLWAAFLGERDRPSRAAGAFP